MNMRFTVVCLASLSFSLTSVQAEAIKFSDYFSVNFGAWNVNFPGSDTGNIVDLQLDETSGSGFQSNDAYLFGWFSIKIKLAGGNTAGTVTTFYMASYALHKNWYELDFASWGRTDEPYTLPTNIFVEGVGNREQDIYLWFDPTVDYHDYGILWNHQLILFTVDDRVIRVFHNARDLGVPYFQYQPLYIDSSIWDGEEWATCGGTVKADWTQKPFVASYTGFNVSNACSLEISPGIWNDNICLDDGRVSLSIFIGPCYEKLYQSSFGQAPNLALSQKQIQDLRWVRSNYLIADYCEDLVKCNGTVPPECAWNWP